MYWSRFGVFWRRKIRQPNGSLHKEEKLLSDSLVEVSNNQIVTDSRRVAEVFGKRHKHVLESIANICSAEKSAQSFFYESNYKDGSGKSNKRYLMNRDGFSLLVMGFNGKKALEWKVKYIEAFNAMEKKLQLPHLAPNPHYRTRMIKTAIKDIGGTAEAIAEVFGVKKGMATSAAMQMIGTAYGVDMEPLKKLLPSEEKPGFLTPTGIAKELGLVNSNGTPKPADINRKLFEMGYQTRIDKEWRLTEKGKRYGEMKPYTSSSGHSGYQIQWHESILDVLIEQGAKA